MKKLKEKIMQQVFLLAACISILFVILICVFLFKNGIPAMLKVGFFNFLFGKIWRPSNEIFGIFPMIVGSLYIAFGALIFGVFLGVFTAIFLVCFCPKKAYPFFKKAIHLLAAIPSVVYGFFGLVVLVPFFRNLTKTTGMSILTASILLALMILPTIVTVSETSLATVPNSYYQASIALGASHEETVFKIIVPASKRGILASILLAIGRAIGETTAVIMVAGNQVLMPKNIYSGIRTLTANIIMEMGYSTDLHRETLIATAVVLFFFILLINSLFYFLHNRVTK